MTGVGEVVDVGKRSKGKICKWERCNGVVSGGLLGRDKFVGSDMTVKLRAGESE